MEEDDDLREIYDLQCWCEMEADPGELKKVMWLEILVEFSCKALST